MDQYSAEYLTMGTHWLWHTFGAISTAMVIHYFYKVEAENVVPKPREEADASW